MIRVLRQPDYVTSEWSGGRTIQLAIAPEGCVYGDRDFLWRISTATVELEESDFTALPDYDRLITPIRGEMILSHNGGPEIPVPVGTIHSFDGVDATHSKGSCIDFNLMLRKGRATGNMQHIVLSACDTYRVHVPYGATFLLYCTEGQLQITGRDEIILAGEALMTDEPLEVRSVTEAVVLEASAMTKKEKDGGAD